MYAMNVMYGEAFEKCIGCSRKIIEGYNANKEEFVIRACNEPDFLEVMHFTFNNYRN